MLNHRSFLIPVIVTTAQIKVCQFNPDNISIEEGYLSDASFDTVPFIRFRKSLSTNLPSNKRPDNLVVAHNLNDRTILIVNAMGLTEFLREWELCN